MSTCLAGFRMLVKSVPMAKTTQAGDPNRWTRPRGPEPRHMTRLVERLACLIIRLIIQTIRQDPAGSGTPPGCGGDVRRSSGEAGRVPRSCTPEVVGWALRRKPRASQNVTPPTRATAMAVSSRLRCLVEFPVPGGIRWITFRCIGRSWVASADHRKRPGRPANRSLVGHLWPAHDLAPATRRPAEPQPTATSPASGSVGRHAASAPHPVGSGAGPRVRKLRHGF
jgi:hypothetical protein